MENNQSVDEVNGNYPQLFITHLIAFDQSCLLELHSYLNLVLSVVKLLYLHFKIIRNLIYA